MRVKTQDPKYDIEIDASGPETARLVNAATGKPIPDDEPIMIWRAQDKKAVGHIWNYADTCDNPTHCRIVEERAADFEAFAAEHPERMKEPDTTPNAEVSGRPSGRSA